MQFLNELKKKMSNLKPIQLGLCCLNWTLRNQKPSIYPSRNIIQRIIKERGIEELKRRVLDNLDDLIKMIEWNEQHGIKVFRLTSCLFPHKANPDVEDYDFDFALDKMKEAGELARKYNQRLTMHPGQYNVVGTPNEDAFQKTILDLTYQADMLDLFGCGKNSVMVVHGGGLYGDKEVTKKRWCENFLRLPENVRNRLVLENCERAFHIQDCLDVSEKINIPVVFDTHHYDCYIKMHPDEKFEPASYYIPKILETWKRRDIKPKFHVSEQGSGRCGHHSDFIDTIPEYLLEIPEKYNVHIDIMIEAKKKELAIFKLYQKYPQLNCSRKKKINFRRRITKKYIPKRNLNNLSNLCDDDCDKCFEEKDCC